ncbi:MAG TPA: ABC transporter permease [Planctomycetota bacterium]|nr:ABC transporter permease [Planctomycetota bacterium]
MRRLLAFLPYVLRTVLRARTRTILTVTGAALAMALFAFVRTVEGGVSELRARAGKPLLVVFQDSRFCPLTSNLPVRYAPAIRQIPGVDLVLPTLIFINSCRANLDLVTLHGVEPEHLDDVYDVKMIAGDLAAWKTTPDGALVGERLAGRRAARVGERLRLGEVDVRVSGIFRSETAGLDNLAFVHIDQLALARKKLGAATQFLVTLKPGASPEGVAKAIDAMFAPDEARTDTKSMQAFVQGAVGEIIELVEFARILGYVAVAIVALVLANTVYISAQARAAEMGILETIGLTKPRLAGLISLEGLGLGLLGGLFGGGAVTLAFWLHPTTLGVEGYGIDFAPSLAVLAQTLAAALVVGALAAIGPATEAVLRPLHAAVKAE